MAAAYAEARIPKPVLAEANFLMKTLSDDDQAFMRKALLVGLEQGGALGHTPSELARLAEGKGHGFKVHQGWILDISLEHSNSVEFPSIVSVFPVRLAAFLAVVYYLDALDISKNSSLRCQCLRKYPKRLCALAAVDMVTKVFESAQL